MSTSPKTRSKSSKIKRRKQQGSLLLISLLLLIVLGSQQMKTTKKNAREFPSIGGPYVTIPKKTAVPTKSITTTLSSDTAETTVELPFEDQNITRSYKKNWRPVTTTQTEPHAINYQDNSRDRLEIHQGIEYAIEQTDFYEWWLANDGEQGVKATISNADQSQYYYVYLRWISGQGWRPEKVELLLAKPTN